MESEQSPEQSPEQSGLSEKLSGDTQPSVGNSKDLRDLIRGGGVQFLCAIATRDVERKYEQKQPKTCNLFLESCYYFSVSTI